MLPYIYHLSALVFTKSFDFRVESVEKCLKSDGFWVFLTPPFHIMRQAYKVVIRLCF